MSETNTTDMNKTIDGFTKNPLSVESSKKILNRNFKVVRNHDYFISFLIITVVVLIMTDKQQLLGNDQNSFNIIRCGVIGVSFIINLLILSSAYWSKVIIGNQKAKWKKWRKRIFTRVTFHIFVNLF
mmetsp:Transcript_18178/g.16079  ORF Transcript_18178/g.16079 Transcript_18178/m.16079 type:complete len:127 (-) Transcript_18178:502-882(-)